MILGQDRAVARFLEAMRLGTLHHAWLLAGPRGVGKAYFARLAATRLLAEAAGPPIDPPGLDTPDSHPIAHLMAAGSHPDFRQLERLERPTGGVARNITVEQVRSLGELFGSTPFLSPWRVVIIDAADDLEAPGANALLKMLEEPPANCLFLLVAHAPGRLLPTIRSRCRRLTFQRLDDGAMASALRRERPEAGEAEIGRLVRLADGSVGRALEFADLDLVPIEQELLNMMREGDPTNALAGKAAAERYAAFLRLVPSVVAREVRMLEGRKQERALDAYSSARETVSLAGRLSLDPAATVFQIGTILASIS